MGLPPYYGQPCWRCNGERLSFRYENYNDDSRSQASMYLCWSCIDCGTESIGVIYDPDPCNVACGWAFDAGMREAEVDALQRHYDAAAPEHNLLALLDYYADEARAIRAAAEGAVAAERERLAAWVASSCSDHELADAVYSGAPAPGE